MGLIMTARVGALPFPTTAAGVYPGMQIALTNTGLNYAREIGVPILLAALKTATIPDFTDNVDTPVGHVKFTLSSVKIQSVSVASSAVASSTSGLTLTLSGISLGLNGHWHYREDSWRVRPCPLPARSDRGRYIAKNARNGSCWC